MLMQTMMLIHAIVSFVNKCLDLTFTPIVVRDYCQAPWSQHANVIITNFTSTEQMSHRLSKLHITKQTSDQLSKLGVN